MKTRHEKAQAFLSSLATNSPELPFEPTLLPELFASTSNSSMSSTTHIATLVERSPGLATRILRMANSAYYGMHTAVSSLSHAIRLLGLNEVRGIILQLGVSTAIRKLNLPKSFPFNDLWEHQILTGNIARAMSQAMPGPAPAGEEAVSPDEMYAAGLLHDLGKTLVAANCPDDWVAIHDLATCDNIPFYRAEEDYWGIDHSIAGARLLTFWGLPAKLTELVGWHHAPKHGKPQYATSTYILASANLLAHYPLAALLAETEGEEPAIALPENVLAWLPEGIDRAVLNQKLADCYDMDRIQSMARASLEG